MTICGDTLTEGNETLLVNVGAPTKGTATAGLDYTATTGMLSVGVGETSTTIVIPILADSIDELPETFTVAIDPGQPNEDRGTILGFGSIVIQQPTTQDHAAGAVVIRVTGSPLAAAPPPSPGNDDADAKREERERETEEERRQRARTNQGNKDDDSVEGDVLETRCDQPWPAVVIANRDGAVEVRLVKEAQSACRSIQVGDYLEADGEKQHEFLFHADSVEVKRRR